MLVEERDIDEQPVEPAGHLAVQVEFVIPQDAVVLALMAGNLGKSEELLLADQAGILTVDDLQGFPQGDDSVQIGHRIEIFAEQS